MTWLVLVSFTAVLLANYGLGALLIVIHRRQHPLRAEDVLSTKGKGSS